MLLMLCCALVSSRSCFVVTYCIHTAYMHACIILRQQHERNKNASCTDCRKAALLFLGVLRIPRCFYEGSKVFL
jgi:hypothetical protein